MPTRSLDKTQRQRYFDRISRELGSKLAEVEITGLGLGNQLAQDWTVLRGMAYDPDTDTFELGTDGLDHLVVHPREVYVEDGADGLHSVQVIDADGNRQLIRLRSPLALPSDEPRSSH
jgi:hypothetical protein